MLSSHAAFLSTVDHTCKEMYITFVKVPDHIKWGTKSECTQNKMLNEAFWKEVQPSLFCSIGELVRVQSMKV